MPPLIAFLIGVVATSAWGAIGIHSYENNKIPYQRGLGPALWQAFKWGGPAMALAQILAELFHEKD